MGPTAAAAATADVLTPALESGSPAKTTIWRALRHSTAVWVASLALATLGALNDSAHPTTLVFVLPGSRSVVRVEVGGLPAPPMAVGQAQALTKLPVPLFALIFV
jgi:hypothetical protein